MALGLLTFCIGGINVDLDLNRRPGGLSGRQAAHETCLNKIIRLFEAGNVCVCGLRGRGKDMLFANVIARRSAPYVSNTDYGGQRMRFAPRDFDCGGNTYKNFISGEITPYVYPFPDSTDIYISDAGVYFLPNTVVS